MNLSHGGHLTHGHPLNFSGQLLQGRRLRRAQGRRAHRLRRAGSASPREHSPKLIVVGASAYPRTIDFAAVREAADESGALLMADIAHIAGLVAAGLHPSPVPHCEFVTTTTHKTLRGPRGGIILCSEAWAKEIDKAVFPGVQGGPLMHVIAAKAVAFKEALRAGVQGLPAAGRRQRPGAGRGAPGRGLPARLGRHRQPPHARRRLREGHHRQGGGERARRGRHHRQQEHDPVRPELARWWPPASASARRPSRRAA